MRQETLLISQQPYETFQRRDKEWKVRNREAMGRAWNQTVVDWGLDFPQRTINRDKLLAAKADALIAAFYSTLSFRLDPKNNEVIQHEIYSRRWGPVWRDKLDLGYTINHSSVYARVTPETDDGQMIFSRSYQHLAPMLLGVPGSGPTYGDVSPLELIQNNGELKIQATTPSGNVWRYRLDVLPVDPFYIEMIGTNRYKLPRAKLITPCVPDGYQVVNVSGGCLINRHCIFCAVPEVFHPDHHRVALMAIEDLALRQQAEGVPVRFTSSAGTDNSPDAGLKRWHLPVLEKVKSVWDQKTPVDIEIEAHMGNRSTWEASAHELDRFARLPNWRVGVANNFETNSNPKIYMPNRKGNVTFETLEEFALTMLRISEGRISVASLGLPGLHDNITEGDLVGRLHWFKRLIKNAGVRLDMNPLKVGTEEALSGKDVTNPVLHHLELSLVRYLSGGQNQPDGVGCVGRCGRCHDKEETDQLLAVAKAHGISLGELYDKSLGHIGEVYRQAVRSLDQ